MNTIQGDFDFYRELIKKGCVLYEKNGIIKSVEAPEFGTVSLTFQDGKFIHGTINKTFK